MKEDAKLRKQRPSKVSLHYRDGLDFLPNDWQRAGISREMWCVVEMGSLFTNPIIILPKGDTVKLVIDARNLNSITDLSNNSLPLELVQKCFWLDLMEYIAQVDWLQPAAKKLFLRTQQT